MKICWDILEKIKLTKNGNFVINNSILHYIDKCSECNDPFISYRKNSEYCSLSCKARLNNNPMYGSNRCGPENPFFEKRHSEISKQLIKQNHPDFQGKNNPNWKGGVKKISLYDTYAPQLEPYEQCRRNINDPNVLEVKCTYCGKWHEPKRSEVVNRIRGLDCDLLRFYCSEECKQSCSIFKQRQYPIGYKPKKYRPLQKEWATLVLKQNNNEYICEICGEYGNIAHHIKPVKCEPMESTDIDNGIIVCESCHKKVHQLPGCGYYELKKGNSQWV
jgi:5-methylcytosine-specific restriction endonuclease McrA